MYNLLFYIFTLMFSYSSDTLQVTIDNIKEVKGKVYVAVFDDPQGFPEDNQWKERFMEEVNSSSVTITISNIDVNKEYAFAVYQDINSNGVMDKNWMGIPKEPFGFSNNIKPKFSAPDFASCKVLPSESDSIEIKLIHKIIF